MPLRILQVASGLTRWGGTEKHVLDISTALAGRGHFVTLACPGRSVLAQRAERVGLRSVSIEMRSAYDWTQLPGFMRTLLVQSGARPGRIDVVPNGIVSASPNPDSGYRLRDALEIPRDAIL